MLVMAPIGSVSARPLPLIDGVETSQAESTDSDPSTEESSESSAEESSDSSTEESSESSTEESSESSTEESSESSAEESSDSSTEESSESSTEESSDSSTEESSDSSSEESSDSSTEESLESSEEDVALLLLANADKEIHVVDSETLVLGEEGKYLLRQDDGAAVPIPAEDWDTPDGYYDVGTQVILDGEKTYLRSEVTARIDSIHGIESKLTILDESELLVDTTGEYGIDVAALVVGNGNGSPPSLTVTSRIAAIRYRETIAIGTNAAVRVQAEQHGVLYSGERTGYNEFDIRLLQGARLDATASGAEGIAIVADDLDVAGATVVAAAPKGIGGIKLTQTLTIRAENGVVGAVDASSDRGRAMSADSINVMGGIFGGRLQMVK